MSENSIVADSQELMALLQGSSPKREHKAYPQQNDQGNNPVSGYSTWTCSDEKKYFPAGQTVDKLPCGFYEPSYCHQRGYFLSKIPVKSEGLIRFPETNSERVIEEIQTFWDKEDLFEKYDLMYKRGIILWGPPGSGKSCTIQLIIADVLERGGVAIKFLDPNMFVECMRIFREIQFDTPLVVLMEDIDSILELYDESTVLNILDGVECVRKAVFLATTNYPEDLGARIINRPSRFDRRFKIPPPTEESRKIYFEHLFSKSDLEVENFDVEKWVRDTDGMSVAHLKELFVAVCVLGQEYEETISILKLMSEDKISSSDDNPFVGFASQK